MTALLGRPVRRERPPRELPRKDAKDQDIRWVRTSVLAFHCNPFEGCWPALDKPLTYGEVEAFLECEELVLPAPFEPWYKQERPPERALRAAHAQKVAWFTRYGFQQPLEVDVGVPSLGCHVRWYVQDGNHRLAAALMRTRLYGEDPWLPLSVSGAIDYAKSLGLW